MEFTRDVEGQEVLLKDGQFQVMMEWERPYMEACVEALDPQGDVLEVGFGCGYSATAIQKYKPRSHTIIEYHPVVAEKARLWAEGRPGVRIVEAMWQEVLPKLGKFDTLFFDDYPLESGDETAALKQQEMALKGALADSRDIVSKLKKELPPLTSFTFSRRDIDEFIDELKHLTVVEEEYLLNFLSDFEQKGILKGEIVAYALEQLVKNKYLSKETAGAYAAEKPVPMRKGHDRFFIFFWECFHHHMHVGARLSCFLEDPTSKYLDDRFFEEIISNPALSYREQTIGVMPPKHCAYYAATEALVFVVQKMA